MNKLQKGFTLIELMVVIAIIGVLAGMLFPAFQTFIENANRTKCASNLKNIGLVMMVYADRNNDWFPVTESACDEGAAWAFKLDQIWEGIKSPELYVCPSDRINFPSSRSDISVTTTSYAYAFGMSRSDSASFALISDDDGTTVPNVPIGPYTARSGASKGAPHGEDGGNAMTIDGATRWYGGAEGVMNLQKSDTAWNGMTGHALVN